MAQRLDDPLGLIHAEALSFALAPTLGRAEAQAEVKTLAAQARETGTPPARPRGTRASGHQSARPLGPGNAGHGTARGARLRRSRADPGGGDRARPVAKEVTTGIVNLIVSI